MFSKSLLTTALVASVAAVPTICAQNASATPTLPTTGGADLPAPNSNVSLKAIAVGHGIQNYTCTFNNDTPHSIGALAVLYDVTDLYPSTSGTSNSSQADFDALSDQVLWGSPVPLNLVDPEAADPGTPAKPNNALFPGSYGAVPLNPFIPPADLAATNGSSLPLKFLGRHFFDANGNPTFDLTSSHVGKRFSVAVAKSVAAPDTADKGILGTGAVKWLQLNENKLGLGDSGPNSQVYRVITAGGHEPPCSKGAFLSVPYTAFYWFYA